MTELPIGFDFTEPSTLSKDELQSRLVNCMASILDIAMKTEIDANFETLEYSVVSPVAGIQGKARSREDLAPCVVYAFIGVVKQIWWDVGEIDETELTGKTNGDKPPKRD